MFCEKCGKEIKDGDKFCPYCGAENEINKEEPSHDIPPDFSVKGAGKKKKGAVIAIAVLVIIVAIGIFKCSSKDEILRYNVHVINNTGFDIYALYASEPDVDNWEEDLLEYGIVYDGERVGKDCFTVFCGSEIDKFGHPFCEETLVQRIAPVFIKVVLFSSF